MEIKEIVKLEDGRQVTLSMSDSEHSYILSTGVNYLLSKGFMAISSTEDIIGTEKAIEEVESAVKESAGKVKQ